MRSPRSIQSSSRSHRRNRMIQVPSHGNQTQNRIHCWRLLRWTRMILNPSWGPKRIRSSHRRCRSPNRSRARHRRMRRRPSRYPRGVKHNEHPSDVLAFCPDSKLTLLVYALSTTRSREAWEQSRRSFHPWPQHDPGSTAIPAVAQISFCAYGNCCGQSPRFDGFIRRRLRSRRRVACCRGWRRCRRHRGPHVDHRTAARGNALMRRRAAHREPAIARLPHLRLPGRALCATHLTLAAEDARATAQDDAR